MTVVLYILCGLIAMSLVRLMIGPTFQDRLMALSLVNTEIVLVIAVLAVQRRAAFFLDVAMVYALLSFGEIVAFVKVHRVRRST